MTKHINNIKISICKRLLSIFLLCFVFNYFSYAQQKKYFWDYTDKTVSQDIKSISDQIENAIKKGYLTFMKITDILSPEMLEENANAATDYLLNFRNGKNEKTNINGIYFIIDSSKMTDSVLIENLKILNNWDIREVSQFRGWLKLQDVEKILADYERKMMSMFLQMLPENARSILHYNGFSLTFNTGYNIGISEHISKCITNIFQFCWEKIDANTDIFEYFHFDKELTQLLHDEENPVVRHIENIVPNPYNPKDPYDLIVNVDSKKLSESKLQYVNIRKTNEGFLFQGFIKYYNRYRHLITH